MTRSLLTGVILLALSSQLSAQNISPTDFRIPESRYRNLLGGLQGFYWNNKNGSSFTEGSSYTARLQFSLNSIWGYNSENEAYIVNSNIDGLYNHSSEKYDRFSFSPSLNTVTRTDEESNIHLNGQYSSYLSPDQVYLYGSAVLNGSYGHHHENDKFNTQPDENYFHKNRAIDGALGGGIGYGKIREASSVFAVARIIEKLREDGYLTRELTKAELLEIVDIYAKRIEYSVHYERPTKYFLDDLLKKLETMGVLKDQRATAYETARVEEVFQEFIFPRIVGWTIQAGISIGKNQTEASSNDPSNPWNVNKSDLNYFTATAQYGYPFSLALHWYNQATISVPLFGQQKVANQYLQSVLYYQIGEKISNEFKVVYQKNSLYQRSSIFPENFNSVNNLSIGNTFRYYLENNINFSITVRYTDWLYRNQSPSYINRMTTSGVDINFGLNYRFF